MKIGNKKMLSFICAMIILLSSICTNIGIISSTVYADTVENISIEQNKILDEEIINNEQITKENENYKSEEKTDQNIEEILDAPKSDEYISDEKSKDKENNPLEKINKEQKNVYDNEESDINEKLNETLDENDEIVEEIKEDDIPVLYAEPGEQATVTHNGYSKWNGSSVGNFFVNGKRVFCIAHDLRSPVTGTLVTAMKTNTWDSDVWLNIIKCLYYGWGGMEPWEGFNGNEAKGVVMTSLALNNFYMGQNNKNGVAFQNYVRSKELPELKLSFSNEHLVGCISGDQQTTNQTTLLGDPNKTITFELQQSVQLHNMTQGTISDGTVTLRGGDTFWLSAPLNIETNWTSPDIYGQLDLLQALVWINRRYIRQSTSCTNRYMSRYIVLHKI